MLSPMLNPMVCMPTVTADTTPTVATMVLAMDTIMVDTEERDLLTLNPLLMLTLPQKPMLTPAVYIATDMVTTPTVTIMVAAMATMATPTGPTTVVSDLLNHLLTLNQLLMLSLIGHTMAILTDMVTAMAIPIAVMAMVTTATMARIYVRKTEI